MSVALLSKFKIDLTTTCYPFDYDERPDKRTGAIEVRLPDGAGIQIPYHYVNIERESFPFLDGRFQLVLLCEVLEHLVRDPMAVLTETNRVLAPGGLFLITTPNVARAAAIGPIRRGDIPYVWSPYSQYGVYGRHNREYSPLEIKQLFAAAGFETVRLETRRFFTSRPALEPARFQGDTTLALGRKVGPVQDRLPAHFYDFSGWWSHRFTLREVHPGLAQVCVENRGQTTWRPSEVYFGLQLWRPHCTLLDRDFRRFDLPFDVPPGATVEMALELPPLTQPHAYYRLDLVYAGQFWFEQRGSQPLDILL
jgi:hypothetical protein